MPNYQSDYVKGAKPMPVGQGPELLSVNAEIDLTAALAASDVLEFCDIPEGHVPVDCKLHTDDLDTGTGTITLDLGILNTGKTAVDTTLSGGGKWLTADGTAAAGGMVSVTDKAIKRVDPSETTKLRVGAVVVAGPNVGATSGKIGVELTFRASHYDN